MLLFLVDSYYRYIILQLIIFTKLPYTSHLGILCRDFITSGEDTLLAIKDTVISFVTGAALASGAFIVADYTGSTNLENAQEQVASYAEKAEAVAASLIETKEKLLTLQSQLAEKDIDIESLNTQITELQKTISNLKMENLTIEAQLYNTAALVNKFYAELQERRKLFQH